MTNIKFNLQLFATNTTGTSHLPSFDPTSGIFPTGTDLSPEMKTFYDMTLIDEASAALVHDQFGQKRPIPANGGKTIEFRKFETLGKAMTPLQEGVTPTGQNLKVAKLESTVAQYGGFVEQSDVLELTAIDNTVLEATKLLGKQAGATLDTITREVLVGGKNKIVSGGRTDKTALTAADTLSVKDVQLAVATLRGQNAPTINGKYVAIIHPYVAYDLMRDPEWTDAYKYANPTNLYNGEIGEIAGVRFVSTTEAKIWEKVTTTGSLSVYATLILGEGAYGVTEITGGGLETIVKQKGSAGTADPLNQRSTVGWKAMKTAERLVENYMVRIESVSAGFPKAAAN